MKFNKIEIPQQWKDYFTKYPHGLTIFEVLSKWVKRFNEVEIAVDDKISEHNTDENSHNDLKSSLSSKADKIYVFERIGTHNSSGSAHSDIRDVVDDVETDLDTHKTAASAHQDIRDNLNLVESELMPESGSNANGSWTKFTDGTMICHLTPLIDVEIIEAMGQLWTSDLISDILFPAEFVGIPSLSASFVRSTQRWLGADITNTKISLLRVISPINSSVKVDVYIAAIGRWK